MEIRYFKNTDQPQVKKLIAGILEEEFAMDQKAYPSADLDSIAEVYGADKEAFFVGEDGGHIIGTVGIKRESPKVAILRRLFVKSNYRGRGYGRLLIDKALDFCRKKGYHEVIFHVSTTMKGAMELCKREGFAEKERLNLGGVDIVRFSLIL